MQCGVQRGCEQYGSDEQHDVQQQRAETEHQQYDVHQWIEYGPCTTSLRMTTAASMARSSTTVTFTSDSGSEAETRFLSCVMSG